MNKKISFKNYFKVISGSQGSKSCKTPLKFLRKKVFKLHIIFLGRISFGDFFVSNIVRRKKILA